MINYFCY